MTEGPERLRLPDAPRPPERPISETNRSAGFLQRWFWLLSALCVLAAVLVFQEGWDTLLAGTDGEVKAVTRDPTAPGFEALVEPTPTMLVAGVDAGGALQSLALLTLAAKDRGGVVLLPIQTAVSVDGAAPIVLRQAHEEGGLDGVGRAVEALVGFGVADRVELDPAQWEQLVAPVAPFPLSLLDPVHDVDDAGADVVRYEAGELAVQAADVPVLLGAQGPGESELNRLVRVQGLWEAWLAAIRSGGDAAVPGERSSGLGRYLRGLASREAHIATLPVNIVKLAGIDYELFGADPETFAPFLLDLVPFPQSGSPGQRLRVRVLDGTGTDGVSLDASAQIIAAGGEVTVVGNASAFGVQATVVAYANDDDLARVERIVAALGVGEAVLVPAAEMESAGTANDVTVTLGQDYLGVPHDLPDDLFVSPGAIEDDAAGAPPSNPTATTGTATSGTATSGTATTGAAGTAATTTVAPTTGTAAP